MRKMKRAIHFDFHTVSGIDGLLKNFDAADFAKTLADANVEYINFAAMCNNGYCYYPTKVGVVYPGLERDILGEIISECHKNGIGVSAYLNVGINFEAAKNHLIWSRMSKDGKLIEKYNIFVHDCDKKDENYFVRSMCFNNNEYVQYVKDIVKEIITYDIDGIFCDGFYPEACFCPICLHKMFSEGIDINDNNAVLEYQDTVSHRFSDEIRNMVGYGKYAFFNNDKTPESMLNTHAEIEVLPSWTWIHYESFNQRAAYLRNIYKERIYMTGRFQRDWGDFGGIRPRAALENDVYDAYLQGYSISFGDHLDPVRGLNKEMYKVIGEIYSNVKKLEPYTENTEYIAEIAVLTKNYTQLHEHRFRAVSRMLYELKYTFDVVNFDMDFTKYKLLIIPDNVEMTDLLIERLNAYTKQGGKILSSGTAGLKNDFSGFALDCYNEIEYCGLDESKRAYFRLKEGFTDYKDGIWAIYYYKNEDETIGGTAIKMKNNGGEQTATYVSAYFDIMKKGLHGCYYTPPKEETEFAVAVAGKNAAHICFDVFNNYGIYFLQAHKVLVSQLIKKLMPEKLICSDLPSTARISLMGKTEYDLLHIKVTYPEHRNFRAVIEEHNVIEKGKYVLVKGKYNGAKVVLTNETLITEDINGYTKIYLPKIVGYVMIKLDK